MKYENEILFHGIYQPLNVYFWIIENWPNPVTLQVIHGAFQLIQSLRVQNPAEVCFSKEPTNEPKSFDFLLYVKGGIIACGNLYDPT